MLLLKLILMEIEELFPLPSLINIGMNVDITHHVELDSTGYPTYSSLSNNAHEILTYIKESNESL